MQYCCPGGWRQQRHVSNHSSVTDTELAFLPWNEKFGVEYFLMLVCSWPTFYKEDFLECICYWAVAKLEQRIFELLTACSLSRMTRFQGTDRWFSYRAVIDGLLEISAEQSKELLWVLVLDQGDCECIFPLGKTFPLGQGDPVLLHATNWGVEKKCIMASQCTQMVTWHLVCG